MAFLNAYVVVSPDNIHFGEQLSIFQDIKEIINMGQWSFILDCKSVDFLIILDKAATAILLCNEETWTSTGQLGFMDFSSLKLIFYKLIDGFLFNWKSDWD